MTQPIPFPEDEMLGIHKHALGSETSRRQQNLSMSARQDRGAAFSAKRPSGIPCNDTSEQETDLGALSASDERVRILERTTPQHIRYVGIGGHGSVLNQVRVNFGGHVRQSAIMSNVT